MTLVQRPSVPQIMGPTDAMYGSITANDDPTRTCRCTDPDVHRLIELIAGGMGQVEASKLLWGEGGRPSAPMAAPVPVVGQKPAPAPVVTPTSAPGARFPWLRRRRPGGA